MVAPLGWLTQELSELGGAFIDLNVEDCGHFALVESLTLPLLANLVQSFQELVSIPCLWE